MIKPQWSHLWKLVEFPIEQNCEIQNFEAEKDVKKIKKKRSLLVQKKITLLRGIEPRSRA